MCGGMVNAAEETAYVLSEATLRARVIVAGVGAGPWRELRAMCEASGAVFVDVQACEGDDDALVASVMARML